MTYHLKPHISSLLSRFFFSHAITKPSSTKLGIRKTFSTLTRLSSEFEIGIFGRRL